MMNRRNVMQAGAALAASGLWGAASAGSPSGFFVPAEEARHQRTFMQWPVSPTVYSDKVFLQMTQQTIADIANAISEFEPVTMLAAAADHPAARRRLSAAVELLDVPTEDLWCRDSGPLFVVNDKQELAVSQIQFNGWGDKQLHRRDAQIAATVAARLGLPLLPTGLVGEPGGIEQDGRGLLIAHESCWVNDNRNPGLSRDEIGRRLLNAYGANRLVWSKGLKGQDITDYHIDSLARLTGENRVLMNLPDEPDMSDPFHLAALETHDRLVEAGLKVDVIPDPQRPRVKSDDFLAAYANYYVCNDAVIAPQFGDKETDAIAHDALSRHYPGREVVMLNIDPLGELGGGIHCATQQMPAT